MLVSMLSVERLSADDRLILWPDQVWPQDIGAVGVLDGSTLLDPEGRFRLEVAQQAIEARLHLLPRFRQILYVPRRGLGGPLWVDSPAFGLGAHLHVARLDAPADEEQLLRAVARLRKRPLDRARPLWEMWFLTGLSGDRIGWFVRLHHVVADGMAGVASLSALLSEAPISMTSARLWTPRPWPSDHVLRMDQRQRHIAHLRRVGIGVSHPGGTLRRARSALPALREIFTDRPGPRTSLDHVVGPDRRLALVRCSLESVNEIARIHDATVNDVLLNLIAGGLRSWLGGRGEAIEGITLPIYVPVSLRRGRRDREGGNLISQMVVPLPLGIADPGDRLRKIAAETTRRKALSRPSLGSMFRSRLVGGVMIKLIARQRVNVVSADLAGPVSPLYFAGAQLLELFPLLNLLGNESLGVGALSYAGQLNVMAVCDADVCPDIEIFAAGARDEFGALAESTARLAG
jgi:diacylglycerol O-acyltransferase